MSFQYPKSAKALHKYIANKISTVYDAKEAENISRILLMDLLNLTGTDIILDGPVQHDKVNGKRLNEAIERLLNNEPLQYILERADFFGFELYMNHHVLIPRPETEELVRLVIEIAPEKPHILDIGTGSGCIAIALAKRIIHSRVDAVDVSEEALEVARRNAKLNLADVDFVIQDILLVNELDKKYDIIVSNPPYIPSSERTSMAKNVVQNEPEVALFVPDNSPFLFYDKIAELGLKSLAENGWLFFEIHEGKGAELRQLLLEKGYRSIFIHQDMQGKNRILQAGF